MKTIISSVCMSMYRVIEHLDGEIGYRVISYKLGEQWKLRLMEYI